MARVSCPNEPPHSGMDCKPDGCGRKPLVRERDHEGFRGLYLVIPPTGGPTEVIGLSVLIWLYAKHQRYLLTLPPPEFQVKLEV